MSRIPQPFTLDKQGTHEIEDTFSNENTATGRVNIVGVTAGAAAILLHQSGLFHLMSLCDVGGLSLCMC